MSCDTNTAVAALATILVIATGIIAWQLQPKGQKLKGKLLLHMLLGTPKNALARVLKELNLGAAVSFHNPAGNF